MTALASAIGLLPLAVGSGPGKELLQPLAIVVLGGLFTSTALTLIVIPSAYAQFSKFLVPKPSKASLQDKANKETVPYKLS
jgi:Cu/Ag efflux pump CusA